MHTFRNLATTLLVTAALGIPVKAQESADDDGAAALMRTRPFLSLMFGLHLEPGEGWTDAFTQLEPLLPPAEWTATQDIWTPAMLRKAAGLLGQAERGDKVAARWVSGRSLNWTSRDKSGCQVNVGVIRFGDAAAARAYLGLAVDLQRKQDELLNAACADGRRVVESRSRSVQLRGVDEAARTDKLLQREANGRTTTVCQIWLRADDRIVEFTWTVIEPDLAWAQRVVDSLAAKLH